MGRLKRGQPVMGSLTKRKRPPRMGGSEGEAESKGDGSESQEQEWHFHKLLPSEIHKKPER